MVKALWTVGAIMIALLVQTALSAIVPGPARILDPFLIAIVYFGLTGGETHGMLAGAVAGWVQDVQFGGSVMGLAGLTKVLVGFGVGLAGTRFLLVSPTARTLVLVAATVFDALAFQWLASVFDVAASGITPLGIVSRAALTSFAGMLVFELVDRRRRAEVRG